MKGVSLLWRRHVKSDGAAIAVTSGLAIDWGGDRESARWAPVEIAVLISKPRRNTQRAKERVVELSGYLKVFYTNHYMTKHFCLH